MNRSFVWIALAGAALVAGCGADPLLGTYAYTETNTFTITAPMMAPPMSGTAMGTLDVVDGTTTDYEITIHAPANSGGGDCTLKAAKGADDTITFAVGQTCAVSGNGATGTATLTSGSGSLLANTLTLKLTYSISGMSPQGSFTATTVDEDTATRK